MKKILWLLTIILLKQLLLNGQNKINCERMGINERNINTVYTI